MVDKMKDGRAGVAIKEFVGLKPKMYSVLVGGSSEHEKAKSVNKNIFATISHNEYENVFLNQKCLRHLINRIQIKNHRIGTYEINKISLSWFDITIHVQNNFHDELALGKSWWELIVNKKNIILRLRTTEKSFKNSLIFFSCESSSSQSSSFVNL